MLYAYQLYILKSFISVSGSTDVTDVTLGASGHQLGTWTVADGTATLSFKLFGFMDNRSSFIIGISNLKNVPFQDLKTEKIGF